VGSVPWWYDDPDSWDTVVLGQYTLPGLAQVKVAKAQKVDVKNAEGQSGATITFKGYEPAKVDIVLRMWTRDQWNAFQTMLPYFEPRPSKKAPQPFDVAHPKTALRGIRSVYIPEIEGPDESTTGIFDITFKCIEFLKPLPHATNTPKTSQDLGAFENQLVPQAPPAPPSATPTKP